MSERGTFAIDRGWFDHPTFAPEPYTEREAWAWLIAEAAYRPHRRRVGSCQVELKRGQFAHSLRFMAEKWKWKISRVRSFLARLKAAAMIRSTESHAAITVVSLCNYDKYQNIGGVSKNSTPTAQLSHCNNDGNGIVASENRTPTAHQPHRVERKEEGKKKEEVVVAVDARARAREPLVSKSAQELSNQIAVLCGHDLGFVPPTWCGAPMRVQAWLTDGWKPEIVLIAVKTTIAKRKTGPPINSVQFFECAIAEEHARQAKPLPNVVQLPASTVEIHNGNFRNGRTESFGFSGLYAQLRARNASRSL